MLRPVSLASVCKAWLLPSRPAATIVSFYMGTEQRFHLLSCRPQLTPNGPDSRRGASEGFSSPKTISTAPTLGRLVGVTHLRDLSALAGTLLILQRLFLGSDVLGEVLPLCLDSLPGSDDLRLHVERSRSAALLSLRRRWCIDRKQMIVGLQE